MKSYLVNFSRPFIYSTAPSLDTIENISKRYDILEKAEVERKVLDGLVSYWNKLKNTNFQWIESKSQIQSLVIPGNQNVSELSQFLADKKINVLPIKSPTVMKGK